MRDVTVNNNNLNYNEKMSTKNIINKKIIHEWFSYNPKTGILSWKKSPARKIRTGQKAGHVFRNRGGKSYRRVGLKGYGLILAHRIIWCGMTGHFPTNKEEIDHKDGNGINNKWSNLRLVGSNEQHKNRRRHSNNSTGVTGVYFHKATGKYCAQINVNGYCHNLGYHDNIEDAIAIREMASQDYGFHPNHGSDRPL